VSRKPEQPAPRRDRRRRLFELPENDAANGSPAPTYEPLPSVWCGDDAELLEKMLCFYPRTVPQKILDATVNAGRFWTRSTRPVVGMDIDARYGPDIVADNRDMPCDDESFDVVVYDPPHIPNQGRDKSKDFNTRFGLILKSPAKSGYNFSHLYPPFVAEAYRVLKPEGLGERSKQIYPFVT